MRRPVSSHQKWSERISLEETNLRLIYEAFNARNLETALAILSRDVRWPNGREGGYVEGREAVRHYWTRQWRSIDPCVTPTAIQALENGSVRVTVLQVVRDLGGTLLSNGLVTHIYQFSHGLITSMEIGDAPNE